MQTTKKKKKKKEIASCQSRESLPDGATRNVCKSCKAATITALLEMLVFVTHWGLYNSGAIASWNAGVHACERELSFIHFLICLQSDKRVAARCFAAACHSRPRFLLFFFPFFFEPSLLFSSSLSRLSLALSLRPFSIFIFQLILKVSHFSSL